MAKKVNKTKNKKPTGTRVCPSCNRPMTDDKNYICENCRNELLEKVNDKDFLNSVKGNEWAWIIIALLIGDGQKMSKTEKENNMEDKKFDKGQILLFYDDENMQVYNVENVQVNNDMHYCEAPMRADMMPIVSLSCIAHTIDFGTRFEKVELDPTTMRRIAKFNKEVEIKNLDKTIEDKKEDLEEVRQEILKQEKKLESLKEFMGKFIKSNSETVEEYFDHDNDYEYYYDEDDE